MLKKHGKQSNRCTSKGKMAFHQNGTAMTLTHKTGACSDDVFVWGLMGHLAQSEKTSHFMMHWKGVSWVPQVSETTKTGMEQLFRATGTFGVCSAE